MNRIEDLFKNQKPNDKLMSLFITAGYPELDATVDLILGFENNGADMIELGMPFSDPLADGPTIQYSSEVAIKNGITMNKIFEMVRDVREKLLDTNNPHGLYESCSSRYGVDKILPKCG
ncbi:MAG: tryptophan synthase subunit alpha [Gracilimonas sp.]|nr:tryptophan synthase subunit alpha [Gracilimonas sp.]